MAHIHLADGTIPLFWTVVWWAAAIVAIAIAVYWLRNVRRLDNRALTLAAFCTAAAFAIFQVNIPLYGGVHLNLTPLIGILTGPAAGGVIVLIVNILSAAIGHGGWGLIGANTIVNLAEVFAAYGIYRGLVSLRMKAFPRAGIATLLALFLGNILMIGIIMVSGIQGVNQSAAQILSGLSVLAGINMGVAVIEAIVTGYIVSYIENARPDILARETSDASEGR